MPGELTMHASRVSGNSTEPQVLYTLLRFHVLTYQLYRNPCTAVRLRCANPKNARNDSHGVFMQSWRRWLLAWQLSPPAAWASPRLHSTRRTVCWRTHRCGPAAVAPALFLLRTSPEHITRLRHLVGSQCCIAGCGSSAWVPTHVMYTPCPSPWFQYSTSAR